MSVKSALRVLQILEYFDEVNRDATAKEIGGALGVPASSAWNLLHTLVDAGYLSLDPATRRYLPTERVAVLGAWAHAPLFGEGRLITLMNDLRSQVNGRVALAAQTGNLVRYIYTVQSGRSSWHFRRGVPLPLLKTSVGLLFLSLHPEQDAGRIIRKVQAEMQSGEERPALADVLSALTTIRRSGYSVSLDRIGVGHGTVSTLLPQVCGQGRPLAVAITSKCDVIRKHEKAYARLMRVSIDKHLGDLMRSTSLVAAGELSGFHVHAMGERP